MQTAASDWNIHFCLEQFAWWQSQKSPKMKHSTGKQLESVPVRFIYEEKFCCKHAERGEISVCSKVWGCVCTTSGQKCSGWSSDRASAVQPRWPSPSLRGLKFIPAQLFGRSVVSRDTTWCYTTLTTPSAFDTGSDMNSCWVYLNSAMANGLLYSRETDGLEITAQLRVEMSRRILQISARLWKDKWFSSCREADFYISNLFLNKCVLNEVYVMGL